MLFVVSYFSLDFSSTTNALWFFSISLVIIFANSNGSATNCLPSLSSPPEIDTVPKPNSLPNKLCQTWALPDLKRRAF